MAPWAPPGLGLKVFTVSRSFCDPLRAAGQELALLFSCLAQFPTPGLPPLPVLAAIKSLPLEMSARPALVPEGHWGRHWVSAGSQRQVCEDTVLGTPAPGP